ncbi:MAG: STAS domain-containing protein, partial [Candidatus Thiodiazotropha endolucinida]
PNTESMNTCSFSTCYTRFNSAFTHTFPRRPINIKQDDKAVQIRVEGHLFYASIDQLSSLLKRHRYDSVLLDLSVVSYMDLSATEALAKDLQNRDTRETTFVIVLTSRKLLDHFQQRLEGMPVEFVYQPST